MDTKKNNNDLDQSNSNKTTTNKGNESPKGTKDTKYPKGVQNVTNKMETASTTLKIKRY